MSPDGGAELAWFGEGVEASEPRSLPTPHGPFAPGLGTASASELAALLPPFAWRGPRGVVRARTRVWVLGGGGGTLLTKALQQLVIAL